VVRKIGEGGMGVVHLGLDGAGREVAIKVLHPHVAADLKARDRLVREVETMRRVRSPYVAEVIDAELMGARPYVVTRFVPGRTLEDVVLSEGPLERRQVIRLAQGLCQALAAVHAAGVIHRDVKPANVMLVDGEPLVIDFGIAHLVDATRLTQSGMFVGTPGYLAPEIIRASQITQAADVHALASTVFFAATGLPPFGTGPFEAVCFNVMEGLAQIDRAPAWLRGWLSRALQVDPAARPSAPELLRMTRELDPAGEPRRPGGGRPDRTLTMNTYSDLLPPVQYSASRREEPPPPLPPTRHHVASPPPQPRTPPADPQPFLLSSRFVGVLLLVTLVALTISMPVVMGMLAAALSLALSVGENLFGEHRRPLSKAAPMAVGHLLLALAVGIVASSLLHGAAHLSTGHAESLAAGVFTLGLFLLPGAGAARQAAVRLLDRVLPGRNAAIVAYAVAGPVALISLIVALGG
jgi:serine/threonine protein kinase